MKKIDKPYLRFMRSLKELGYYNAWIIERRKQNIKRFDFADKFENFQIAINRSLTWAITENPELWFKLYYFSLGMCFKYVTEHPDELKYKMYCGKVHTL